MREEKVIWRGAPELTSFYGFYAAGILALIMAFAVAGLLGFPLWAWCIVLPFCFFMFVLPLLFRRAWLFTVTDRCVRSEFNFGARRFGVHRVLEAPIQNVTDVIAVQGFLGRLLGFGEVHASTAGTFFPGVSFWGVREPFKVASEIRGLVTKAKAR
jgi:membrane protein YdbS with pleckstrin-like domain